MKKAILFAGLALLVLSAGCIQPDISPQAKQLPEIKAVYDLYPNAAMTTLFLPKDAVVVSIDDIRRECKQNNLPVAAYWFVTVKTGGFTQDFYVDEQVTKVVCVIDPSAIVIPPKNDCNVTADCDDGNSLTKDECRGIPKKCVYTSINACRSNDGFCPPGCKYANDRDCPAIDECQTDVDCLDSNHFTVDSCTATTPKECKHELKTCEQLRGYLCNQTSEACGGKSMPSKDRDACCETACVKTGSCTGVTCQSYQKCVNGKCYDKTCAERELELCITGEICTKEFFKDALGITCCTGECKRACSSDANCSSFQICKNSYCVIEKCADIGGKVCNATTEVCGGEIEKTLDTPNCCTECRLKKCGERGGVVCDEGLSEKCTQKTIETFDSSDCCMAECIVNWCVDKPCAINQKCDETLQKCVLKTCEEMKGLVWVNPETCRGLFYEVAGSAGCCLETTCLEIGGEECATGSFCDGETRIATDTDRCCIGDCLEYE